MNERDYPTQGRFAAEEEDAGLNNVPIDPTPDVLKEPGHVDLNSKVTVKINGQEIEKTVSELVVDAQKGLSAQEKFEQAAAKERELEGIRGREADMEAAIKHGDVDAFRRLGAAYGVPGNEVEAIVDDLGLDQEDDDDWDDGEGDVLAEMQAAFPQNQGQRPQKIDYNSLSPDLQRVMRLAERQRISDAVKEALDKDEVLSYNLKRMSPEAQGAVQKLVNEKIQGRLGRYGGDFGDGSQILPDITAEVREIVEALGTTERTHGRVGLGASPGGGSGLGYPMKKPDHVSSSENSFDQHILDTLQYNAGNAEDGR